MSVRVSAAVWSLSKHKGSDLIVLLCLADMARDDGVSWPGVAHLAKKARISERQAVRVLKSLRESGELEIVRQGGGGHSTLYRINLALLFSRPSLDLHQAYEDPAHHVNPDELGGVMGVRGDIDAPLTYEAWGVTFAAQSRTPMSPEPLVEPLVEPSRTTEAADAAPSGVLPGMEDLATPVPSSPADPEGEATAEIWTIWTKYVEVFDPKVKALTAPRERDIRKALKAVGGDVGLCKLAILGLKSYREKHPTGSKDTSISVVFATGPHSRSNLTDQIQWWADQAELKGGASGVRIPIDLSGVPSVTAGTIRNHREAIRRMVKDSSGHWDGEGRYSIDQLQQRYGHRTVLNDPEEGAVRWELDPDWTPEARA